MIVICKKSVAIFKKGWVYEANSGDSEIGVLGDPSKWLVIHEVKDDRDLNHYFLSKKFSVHFRVFIQ